MPSKFNEETRRIILEALRQNPSVSSAASKVGISPVTLNRWLHQGEEGDPEYAEFALEAAEARRTMKDEVVAALYKTATDELHPQQTKAAHLLLTNLYPAEFSVVRHTVQHKAEDPEIDLSKLSRDEKRLFHAQLKKIVSGDDDASALTVIDVSNPKAEA